MVKGRIRPAPALGLLVVLASIVSTLFGTVEPSSLSYADSGGASANFTPQQEITSQSYLVALEGCAYNGMKGDLSGTVSDGKNVPVSDWFGDGQTTYYVYPSGSGSPTPESCSTIMTAALKLWGFSSGADFLAAMGYTYSTSDETWHGIGGLGGQTSRSQELVKAVKAQVYPSLSTSATAVPTLSAAAQYDLDLGLFSAAPCSADNLGAYPTGVLTAYNQTVLTYVQKKQAAGGAQAGVGKFTAGTVQFGEVTTVPEGSQAIEVDGYAWQTTGTSNGATNAAPPSRSPNPATETSVYGQTNYDASATGNPGNRKIEGCDALASAVTKDAPLYAVYLAATGSTAKTPAASTCENGDIDPPTCVTPPQSAAATCGSTVAGIGWIVCPLFDAIGTLDDGMWNFASALLNVSPVERTQTNADGTTSSTTVYKVWQAFQAIANVVLVIVFLIIIFSQLTNAGVSNYGVKKTLPRLVVVAILINISFTVMQVAVDVANIVGSSLYDLITALVGSSAAIPTWSQLLGTILTLGVAGTIVVAAISISTEAAVMFLIPGVLAALLGFLAAVLTLMFRQAVIPILVMVAPLAFAAYLLPNTKPWFDRWFKLFSSMLLLFPLAALMFGGVKVAAIAISGDQSKWWLNLTSLIVLGAPLFMLPLLARQSGTFLGKINSGLRGLGGKLEKPVSNWADSRRKLAIARSDARTAVDGSGNPAKRVRAWAVRRRKDRELKTAAWQAQADEAYNAGVIGRADALSGGMAGGGAGQATIRATAARAQAEQIKLAMESMRLEAGFNANDRNALARTLAQAIEGGEATRAVAATNYLAAARGVDELHQTISEAQRRGVMSADMTRTLQQAVTSDANGGVVKERRADLSSWGATGGDVGAVTSDPSTWQRLSAEDASKLSGGALAAAEAARGISVDIANRVLNTPQLRASLDGTKEQIFLRVAGSRGTPRANGGGGVTST